jgi:hypothetical protein
MLAAAVLVIHSGAAHSDANPGDTNPSDTVPADAGSVAIAEVGSTLPALTFEDQHEELHTLDASVKLIVFTRDMDAGGIVKETLAENGGEVLAANGAVYISDVHGMPSLIRSLFALPSMRKRPYSMWLDVEGEDTKILPATEGQPSLIHLDAMTVSRIDSVATAAALREALGMPAAPSEDEE